MSSETVHEFDPNMAPDSEFEPGALHHLVVGNSGRMFDPRRTPIVVTDLRPDIGMFELEVAAFEDVGARWWLPFERVGDFQFANGSPRSGDDALAELAEAIERFDHPLLIPAEELARPETDRLITEERTRIGGWLERESAFVASGRSLDLGSRQGESLLYQDLQSVMEVRGLAEIERVFAGRYVSNPFSGELVKGHVITLAEMGLAAYDGKVIRDPKLFDPPWTKERRRDHLIARLAFLRELFRREELSEVTLYRAWAAQRPPPPRAERSLVSATFSHTVADSLFAGSSITSYGQLLRQPVPIDRLLMTYLETEQMNDQFLEAEAVLLADPASLF